MSCASATDRRHHPAFAGRHRAGLTLLEMLTAVAIALIFVGGTALAIIQMMRSNDRAAARLEAIANARHALSQVAADLKHARRGPPGPPAFGQTLFQGINSTVTLAITGNHRDDDGDGRVDEEVLDGTDADSDWSTAEDRHALITSGTYERQSLMGRADPGDGRVDEDLTYSFDSLWFRRFPMPSQPTTGILQVKYSVEPEFDGAPSVLVRELQVLPTQPGEEPTTSTGPVAFSVLSFDTLFWDPQARNWREQWTPSGRPPGLELPVSVLVSITVYAGKKPLEQVDPAEPLETVTLSTVVNIEQVLASPQYAAARPVYP